MPEPRNNVRMTTHNPRVVPPTWREHVELARQVRDDVVARQIHWGQRIKLRDALSVMEALAQQNRTLLGALDGAVSMLDEALADDRRIRNEHDLTVARLEVALAGANNEIKALAYQGPARCRCSIVPVTIDGRDLGGIVMMQAEDHIAERELARVTAVERDVERSKRHQAERDRSAAAADLRTARKEANKLAADLIRARQATRDLEVEREQVRARGAEVGLVDRVARNVLVTGEPASANGVTMQRTADWRAMRDRAERDHEGMTCAAVDKTHLRTADHLRETRAELGRERRASARLVTAASAVLPAPGEPENQRPTRAAMRELGAAIAVARVDGASGGDTYASLFQRGMLGPWAAEAEALKDSPIGAVYFGNAEIPTNTDGSVTFNIIPSVGRYQPGPGDQSPVNGC